MGKDPDAIYDEITAHRRQMEFKREQIQERVASDLRGVKDKVAERSPDRLQIGERVSAHPMSYVAGGFGTGVLLGMITPGMSLGSNGNGHSDGRQNGRGREDGSGMMGGVTSALSGTMLAAFDDAVRPIMRDVMAGFKGDDRSPDERDRQA